MIWESILIARQQIGRKEKQKRRKKDVSKTTA